MRSLLLLIALITITESFALETATQPDLSSLDVETAKAFEACVNEAVADESGYELDESEVQEYCRPSNY